MWKNIETKLWGWFHPKLLLVYPFYLSKYFTRPPILLIFRFYLLPVLLSFCFTLLLVLQVYQLYLSTCLIWLVAYPFTRFTFLPVLPIYSFYLSTHFTRLPVLLVFRFYISICCKLELQLLPVVSCFQMSILMRGWRRLDFAQSLYISMCEAEYWGSKMNVTTPQRTEGEGYWGAAAE